MFKISRNVLIDLKLPSFKYGQNVQRLFSITANKWIQSDPAAIEKKNQDRTSVTAENVRAGNINISTKSRKKFPQREPFLKNLFIGKLDTDLLAYPEVLSNEEIAKLNKDNERLVSHFQRTSNLEDEPTNLVEKLKNLKSFGLNIPQIFNGREYLLTESLLTSEIESSDTCAALLLNSHRSVIEVILKYGSDTLKEKYLEKLSNGDIVATFAFFETQLADPGPFNTIGCIDSDENSWLIKGQKDLVLNGPNASLFLVVAKTDGTDSLGNVTEGCSMFLVDANSDNVIKGQPDKTFGCDGLPQSTIVFQNTKVPIENVVGKINDGTEISQTLLKYSRIQSGVVSLIKMKSMLKELVEFAIVTKVNGESLIETELVRERLALATCNTYAIESMIYMTSGLIDNYENQEVDLEATVLKVFSLEKLFKLSIDSFYTKGPTSLFSSEPVNTHFRDSANLLTQSESIDSLKLFIGLTGVQHAGINLNETVKKVRNPLFHPEFIFKRLFFDRRDFDNPKLTLKISEYLHPTLDPAAQWLEESIIRLQLGTELLLTRYGPEIVEKHTEILRVGEAITLIYATLTSISRASRAYCIGLRNADYEMLTASVLALQTKDRVKVIINDIVTGPYVTNDANIQKLGKRVCNNKGYFFEHPTTLNF